MNLAAAGAHLHEATIKCIVYHDWGDILIELEGGANTSEDCDNKSFVVLDESSKFFDKMHAAALSAFHANSSIKGWVSGCAGRFKSPKLIRMDLVK